MKNVILSTPMLMECGSVKMKELTLEQTIHWVKENQPKNYSAHATVRLLGVEPATSREQCDRYDNALCLKAKARLEFGKEYTIEEIQEIGVTPLLISYTP